MRTCGSRIVAARFHGLVDARGAAWLIYPSVLAGWAYIGFLQHIGVLWSTLLGIAIAIGVAIWLSRRVRTTASNQASGLAPAPGTA